MDNELKQLLYDECLYKMPDELYGRFIEAMTDVRLKNREVLIPYGKLDTNVYVLKSGIMRLCYFDGEKEKTYGFAIPGSMMISYHSFYMRQPAHFQLESCGNSLVGKISMVKLYEMIEHSHEFAQWMLSMSIGQLYFNEFKSAVINGPAKERYISLVKNRPEIISRVPLKIIASYLGVTPNYLSRLKKNLLISQNSDIV